MTSTPSPFRPIGSLAVGSALEVYRGPWTSRLAAHLLRRAGFGGAPSDVDRLTKAPMREAVTSLVNFPSTAALPAAPSGIPDVTSLSAELRALLVARRNGTATADDARVQMLRQQRRMLEHQGVVATQVWWLNRMIATPAPLQEKMTLFWHGLFTSTALQKGVTPAEILTQNLLFRANALGNARNLTRSVALDPAMLRYLDNVQNTRSHPNENFSRELMELFTLGLGNYTEADVREAARAWTGLRIDESDRVALVPRLHDDGVKTFMGRTGPFGGSEIIGIIFEQPEAATFLADKLLNSFVYNAPEPELIYAVADLLRRHDFELAPVMATIFSSNVFYSERAYRALVKSPVEFVVGTHQLFNIAEVSPATLPALTRMGQTLFYPPNVKGWPGGATWLNSSTVLARENFANALLSSKVLSGAGWLLDSSVPDPAATAQKLVTSVLQGDSSAAALARVESYLRGDGVTALAGLTTENYDQRIRGGAYLTLAMPAYQLA